MMKNLNFKLALVFIFGGSSTLIAQESSETALQNNFSQISKSSAKANVTNGALNLNIPLLNVDIGEATIPIYLYYSSGQGHQAKESAGIVGYGWQLDYGGSITREMIGLPDDLPFEDSDDNQNDIRGYLNHSMTSDQITFGRFDDSEYFKAGTGKMDYQPDRFSYQLFDNSGSFYLSRGENPCAGDVVGKAVQIPRTANTISLDYSTSENEGAELDWGCFDFQLDLEKFTVQTPEMLKGFFLKNNRTIVETNNINGDCSGSPLCGIKYFSEWSIGGIIGAYGDTLAKYNYSDTSFFTYTRTNYESYEDNESYPYQIWKKDNVSKKEYTKPIEIITLQHGSIQFIYDEYSSSEGHRKLLKELKYLNAQQEVLKIVHLNYTVDTPKLLLSVEYLTPDGQIIDKINLQYNPSNSEQAEQAYNKSAFNRYDYWGFYNGNNTDEFLTFLGADRTPDLDSAQHLALSGVNYLNGRSDSFTYELNEYTKIAGYDSLSSQNEELSYPFSFGNLLTTNNEITQFLQYKINTNNPLEVITGQEVNFKLLGLDNNQGGCPCNRNVAVKFQNITTGEIFSATFMNMSSTQTESKYLAPGKYWVILKLHFPHPLEGNDNHPLNCSSLDPICPSQYDFRLTKKIIMDDLDYTNKKAGGLRLKSHIIKDNNGSIYTQKYMYNKFEHPLYSSGYLLTPVITSYLYGKADTIHNPYFEESYTAIPVYKSYIIPDNRYTKQGPVMYTDIQIETEAIDGEGNEILASDLVGKEVKRFSFHSDNYKGISIPYAPLSFNDWENGNLISIEKYNTENKIVYKKDYSYAYLDTLFDTIEGTVFNNSASGLYLGVLTQYFSSKDYALESKFYYLKSTKEKYFDDGIGKDSVITTTDYGNYIHLQPTEITKTFADGTGQIKKIKYSGDFGIQNTQVYQGDQSLAIENLVSNGYIGVPIETAIFTKSNTGTEKLLSSQINLLNTSEAEDLPRLRTLKTTQLLFPTQSYSMSQIDNSGNFAYTASLFENTLHFNRYNSDNQIIESENRVGEFNCQLRNIEDNKVIGIVRNGRLATSRYTSFEDSDYNGGWYYDQSNVVAAASSETAITGDTYYNLAIVDGNNGNFQTATGAANPALPPGKYLLSFWRKGDVNTVYYKEGDVSGGSDLSESSFTENGWTYTEKIVSLTGNDNYISIEGTGFIDELRLHEIDATMETKGYYPDGKVKYQASASGDVATYEYDAKNRLEWVLDRKRDVMEHHEYQEKVIGDPDSYNVHTTFTARMEGLTKANFATAHHDTIFKHVEFMDGLGRFRQSIDQNATSSNREMITFADYDPFGREQKKHLPYFKHLPANQGYISDAKTQQENYYLDQDDPDEVNTAPYTETILENSPLQRPVETGGIGEELQPGNGHSTHIEYGWNTAADNIRKWVYDSGSAAAAAPTIYAANKLRKKTITGPDGRVSSTFTDARGRKVATTVEAEVRHHSDGRIYTGRADGGGTTSTAKLTSYAVYDDFGRVIFEIPAKAMEELAINNEGYLVYCYGGDSHPNIEQIVDELITGYSYDQKGRIWQKNMPGNGRQKFVHNNLDRMIMSQDEQKIDEGIWDFVKYDTRGRVVLKGTGNISGYYTDHRDAAAGHFDSNDEIIRGETYLGSSGSLEGYSNLSYPDFVSENQLTNVYYFDNYDFLDPSEFEFIPFSAISDPLEVTRGLPTGSKTRILNADGSYGNWLTTVSYYDDKKRPIQAFTKNHKGGWDRIDTYYNEYGQVEKTVQFHRYEDTSPYRVFSTRFEYFDNGKLHKTYCKMDNDPEVEVSCRWYDEKGQLKDLKLHKRQGIYNYLQNIDYRYNDQGNLTHINNTALIEDAFNDDNDDVFGQELTYFDESPEYYIPPGPPPIDGPYNVTPQYGGNISSMMWNAKTPEEDGAMLNRHAYVYNYDDLGNLTKALYGSDEPSNPGLFNVNRDYYNEQLSYDIGGNIVRLKRNRNATRTSYPNPISMDDISYTYKNHGYLPEKMDDAGESDFSTQYKHFIDTDDQSVEYTYDASGRTLQDRNKKVTFAYNALGLPRTVQDNGSGYKIEFLYDAAGNKLQKHVEPPFVLPDDPVKVKPPLTIDYIGNFVYQNGKLKMIYQPEGVIRPTPSNADNETDYVYDYFIKDYLGNVRVVLTEENATDTTKFLATMEDTYRVLEKKNFDNIDETVEDKPSGYPLDGSAEFNEKIAKLSEATGTEVGPSIVLPVQRGDKVSLSTKYFYEEVGEGETYDNTGFLVNQILMSLATSGAGVLNLTEGQLIDIASGAGSYGSDILNLLSNNFDTTDVSKPHSYMIWMLYDNNMKLIPEGSGAKRVTNPNELGTLIEEGIPAVKDGYLHCFVSNKGVKAVNFDNFMVTYLRGNTRQINHYYPYGLSIDGLEHSDEYLNKYTSKELQTGEFDPTVSSGLEMFDFGARFYDPALGRWFTPDPAEQFHNPYLAMANNPVRYIDPSGSFAGNFYIGTDGGGGGNNGGESGSSIDPFPWDIDDSGYDPWASQVNWSANHGSYLPSSSSWLNAFGAHNGSFAPYRSAGKTIYYHNGNWGYRQLGTAHNGAFDPGNGAFMLTQMEVIDIGGKWVYLNKGEIISAIGDHWRSLFFNFQKQNFLGSTDRQNIEHIINEMRRARKAGLENIDLRSIFESYPYRGGYVDLASIININNENIPMHINLAIYDDMKIDLFKINMKTSVLNYGNFKGIDLTGEYNQWRFSAINGNKPMMVIQFRLSNPDFLYNYIYK